MKKYRRLSSMAMACLLVMQTLLFAASPARADSTIPSGFTEVNTTPAGTTGNTAVTNASASFANGQFTLSATGGKLQSSGDTVYFVYIPVTGDFSISAKVVSDIAETGNTANNRAMLMVKKGTGIADNAYFTYLMSGTGLNAYKRFSTSGKALTTDISSVTSGPVFLKMERKGNVFSSYYSTDGTNYGTAYTSTTDSTNLMPSTVNVGLAVTAGTAVFSDVKITDTTGTVYDSTDGTVPAPAGLTATVSNNAYLSWTAVNGASSYNIKRSSTNGSGYTSMGTSTTNSYTDTTVQAGNTYYYVVTAVNGLGTESANSNQAVAALVPPTAPAGLTAASGNNKVDLAWTAVSGAASYKVQRSTSSGSGYIAIGTSTTAAYSDTSALNGQTYYYVVSAVNSFGESPVSSQVTGAPKPAAPSSPTGLTATPGNNTVQLAWSSVNGANGYNIKRSTTNGSGYATIGTSTTPSYADNTAQNNTTYYYVVTATDTYNQESAASPQVSVTPSAPIVTAPAAPTGLTATAGDKQVTLNWAASAGTTSYNVKRSTDGGQTYAALQTGLTSTHFTDTGLTNGNMYYYIVSAVNSYGESPNSSPANASPTSTTVVNLSDYNINGFAASGNVTGGGNLPETDPKYIKVYNADDFAKAINYKNGYKVIEIMNDLDLGWNEISNTAKTTAGSLMIASPTPPLMHPVLLQTGITMAYLQNLNGVTIFSANGSKIRHIHLDLKHSSNIIIRNLEFDELWEWDEATKGNYDKNDWDYMTVEDDNGVWIDHCTFHKSYDGVVDIKKGSQNVTISWTTLKSDDMGPNSWVRKQFDVLEANKSSYTMYSFLRSQGLSEEDIIAVSQGQKKTHLVGATEFASDNAQLSVTLHHNYYENSQDRLPRLRGGNAHDYNVVMDSAKNWAAQKRISSTVAAAISAKGYHFGVTSQGALSTEGGAVLVEKSVLTDISAPLRNNQVDPSKTNYTGKILAKDTIYSMDGVVTRGDSDAPGSPMTPIPAAPLPFSWSNGLTQLPYTYTPDDPSTLAARLLGPGGSGAGKLSWPKNNWLLTSGYAATATATAVPGAVGGIKATAQNDGTVALSWYATSTASGYNVKRSSTSGSGYQTIAANVQGLTFTDNTATTGNTYYYVVSAVNSVGEGSNSLEVSVTPKVVVITPPSAPANLTAKALSGQVSLAWSSVSGADTYKVKRSLDNQTFSDIATTYGPAYTDTNVVNNTTYYYQVTALNSGGESAASNVITATPVPPADPTAGMTLVRSDDFEDGQVPNDYILATNTNTSIAVATAATAGNANNKALLFHDTNTGSANADAQATFSFPTQSQEVVIKTDFMQPSKGDNVKIIRMMASGGGSTFVFSIETKNGNLNYRVAGPSGSSSDTYTSIGSYNAGTWYNIMVDADFATQKADVYVNGILKLSQVAFYAPNSNASLLMSDTSNAGAYDHYLDNIQVYGAADPTLPPATPANLRATAGDQQVILNWNTVSNATSYSIYDVTSGSNVLLTTVTANTYTVTGLKNNTAYSFAVSAINLNGESPVSSVITATPAAAAQAPAAPTGLTAMAGNAQVSLTWTAVNGAAGYNVKRSTASGGGYTQVGTSTTASYTDTGLTNGVTYYYVVEATNASGTSAASSQASATPAAPATGLPAVTLSGAASVKPGQQFSLTYGLANVQSSADGAVYAQDLTFQFDPTHLEFVSAEALKSTLLLVQVKPDNALGQVRIIAASGGAAGAVTADGPLLQLNWKAKPTEATVTTSVSTLNALLASGKGEITTADAASAAISIVGTSRAALQAAITEAQAAYDAAVEGTHTGEYPAGAKAKLKAAITDAQAVLADAGATQEQLNAAEAALKQALQAFKASELAPVPGDANNDRKVDIGDLALVSVAYGLTSSSPDWEKYKHLDFNHDGQINITDLVYVASLIP